MLIAARAAREAGGLNDQKQFSAFLADWNSSVAAAGLDPRTEAGNAAAMAVVRRHAISAEEFAARSRAREAREADAAEIDLDTANEAQLRGRLRHLARQAKATGGPPGKQLVAERKRVEAAIDRLTAAAKAPSPVAAARPSPKPIAAPKPPAPKPAPVPEPPKPAKATPPAVIALPGPAAQPATPSADPAAWWGALDIDGRKRVMAAASLTKPPRVAWAGLTDDTRAKLLAAAGAAEAPADVTPPAPNLTTPAATAPKPAPEAAPAAANVTTPPAAVTTPAPKPRPKPAKAEETGHAKRARKTLGDAPDGDVIQASAAIGYMSADTPMRVTRIEKNGTVVVENVATGASTTLSRGEMEGARARGVTFSRAPSAMADKPPALVDKPASMPDSAPAMADKPPADAAQDSAAEAKMRAQAAAAIKRGERRQRANERRAKRVPNGRTPRTLTEFLASRGGLRDDRGDIRAMADGNPFVPGFGALLRPTGMAFDRALEAALEANVLPPGTTVREMIARLDDEMRGLNLDPESREGQQKQELQAEADAERYAERLQEIRTMAAELGADLRPGEAEAAAAMASAEGIEVADALVTVLERNYDDALQEAIDAAPADTDWEIPWDEDASTAAGPAEDGEGRTEAGRVSAEFDDGAARGASPPGGRGGEGGGARGQGALETETVRTLDGTAQQGLIPGVSPVTDRDRLGVLADKPLRGGNAAPPAGGLFDPGATQQPDMMDLPGVRPKRKPAAVPAPAQAPDADIGQVDTSVPNSPRRAIRVDRAIIGHDLGVGREHPDYEAAKAGDVEAATRIALSLVDDEMIERVRQAIGARKPIVVPVVSIEAAGRNKIPLAASRLLARRLGLPAGNDIVQANAPKRTALSGLDRVFAQPAFDGAVEAGRDYLILDDTLTQGGTFAALASHIEAGGGRVIAAVALTGKDYSATLRLSPDTLRELRGKFGDVEEDFRAATGHGFDALTESEARYLVRFRPADAVRNRITEGGRQGSEQTDRRNSAPPGIGDPSTSASVAPAGWGEAETSNEDPPLTPEALAALGDILRVIAGPEAVLEQGRTGSVDGIAAGPLVRLSMSLGEDRANWVTGHEAIHTLRNLGRITPAEWATLTDAAAREGWGERFGTDRRYRNRTAEVRAEEAVAEAFAAWATGNLDGRGPVARIFQRIKSFLERLRNALAKRGFNSRESIFRAIRRGGMGRRAPGSAAPTRTGTATPAEISAALDARVDAGVFTQDGNGLIHLALPPEKRAEQDGRMRGFLRDVIDRAQPTVLATVPLRPLLEEVAGYLPSAARFLRTKQAMDAMRSQWFATSADLSNKWLRFRSQEKAANVELMDLMHASTLAGIDPSAPVPDGADAETRAQHAALRQRYDALPAAGQALYNEVRDTYSKLADAFDAALMENVSAAVMVAARDAEREHRREVARIEASEAMSPQEKQAAREKADKALKRVQTVTKMNRGARMQKLRQQFEANRLPGPYFPLARFGEFFVTARDKTGKVVSYSLFEWPAEQRAFAREMEAAGYSVTMDRVSNEKGGMRGQVDPRFVAEVEGLLANAKVPADLQDAIWQRFLQRMPDMSIRTSRIHRKGTAGFTKDAIRAFGHHMFHGSHQLARLNYAMELQDHLANAREEAQESGKPNSAVAVVNEMANRLDFIMNPTGAAWSHMLTSAGFVYFLSASPAAALLNLTQTAVVGVPILAASKGGSVLSASTQLSRALKDVGSGFSAKEWRSGFVSAARSSNLTPDERSLIREIYEIGLADSTQAHDLAGVAESGVAYNNAVHKAMSVISYGFHHAERVNREATALAAYRMQRKAGLSHAEAVEEANRLTWKIHFDYQATSRPRAMQGDVRKVVLLFRNFTVNMLFRLFRDTHQMLRGGTAEVRREARAQLVGMTMMMMATAGIKGVWGYGIAMGLASLFFGAGADEEDELRKWMQRNLGTTAAAILLDGLPGYGLGISLSERIGMPDLWFRSSDRLLEGKEALYETLGQLMGPVLYGIPSNVHRGASMVLDGLRDTGEWREVFRGVETAMPKSVRDLMRAGRFATEGAMTMRGEALLESVPRADVLKQALGFTPARLAEIYGQNTSLQNAQKEIGDRRTKIMNSYYRAFRSDDLQEMRRIEAGMRRFNEEHPESAITPSSLGQSMRTRARTSAQTVNGVRLPPRMDGPLRERLPERTYN